MRPLAAMVVTLFVAAAGCGEVDQPIIVPEGEILAGTAALDGTGFLEVPDGADAELVPGSQGGFHVWLNVRVHGLAGLYTIEREARRVRDDQLIYRGQRQTLEVPDQAMSDWWDHPTAAPAFMCPSPIGVQVFDEEVRFEVRLLDDDGAVLARDPIVLTPRCPAGDQAAFCVRICSG